MNNKVKILHITEATSGGVWTHLNQVANGIDKEKFDQIFILSSLKNKHLREENEFQKHKYYIVDMVREISLFKDLRSIYNVLKIIKKENPDILHCHSSKAGLVGRLVSVMCKNLIVMYTPHSFAFNKFNNKIKNFIFISAEKVLGLLTDKIICVSQDEYQQALDYGVISQKRLSIIKNGIEIKPSALKDSKIKKQFLIEHGFKGQEYVIGFIARLAKQKDPITFLKACMLLKEYNVAVFLVGDGPLEEYIENEIQQSESSSIFYSVGYSEKTELYFNNIDCFVSSSLWEGLPYSVLESINYEVPVISSSIDGVTELIEHGKTGLLFEVGNAADLRENIEKLMNDSILSANLVKQAKAHLTHNYSLIFMIQNLEKLYTSMYLEKRCCK